MIIEAIDYISQMKMQLSNAIQNYDRLEIQLDDQDVYDLQSFYANLIENMQDVRAICSKPFHS
jgi:c-di-AMP phosphodiesterase-like protein